MWYACHLAVWWSAAARNARRRPKKAKKAMEAECQSIKMRVVVVSFKKLRFIRRNSRALAHPSLLPLTDTRGFDFGLSRSWRSNKSRCEVTRGARVHRVTPPTSHVPASSEAHPKSKHIKRKKQRFLVFKVSPHPALTHHTAHWHWGLWARRPARFTCRWQHPASHRRAPPPPPPPFQPAPSSSCLAHA